MPTVARATVFAYLQMLTAVVVFGVPAVTDGSDSLAVASQLVLCGVALAVAASLLRHPEQVSRGADPASRWLLALAGVATLAALWFSVSLVDAF
mgnify:CR=1 FL=1